MFPLCRRHTATRRLGSVTQYLNGPDAVNRARNRSQTVGRGSARLCVQTSVTTSATPVSERRWGIRAMLLGIIKAA